MSFSMDILKIHGVEDHLLKQYELLNGFGDHTEDFVELSHQIGAKEDIRTKALLNAQRAANSSSAREKLGNDAEIIAIQDEKRKLRKRNHSMKSNAPSPKEKRDQVKKEKKIAFREKAKIESSTTLEDESLDVRTLYK